MKFKYALIFLGTLLNFCLKADMASFRNANTNYYTEIRTKAAFDEVMSSPKPQIIDFSTGWCSACTTMKPTFNTAAKKYNASIGFNRIDLDNKDLEYLQTKYKIESVPTTIFFKSGKEINRIVGSMSEADIDAQVNAFNNSK